MENTTNTTQTPGAENAPIKFSRKLQNFNVLANNGAGEFIAIKTTGYKTSFNGVLLGIQKQEGTHEKYIIDLETGFIIFKVKNLKQLTFETLETFESYYKIKSIKYIYNYENILKLCNYLLKENFNNIVLLEPRFIKNFDFESFRSDMLVFDSLSYNNAVELASYAKNKIMHDLKPGSKYDNTFYRFHEGKFEISILYNCYNDIIIIDNIENLDAAKKQVDEIKRPDALIKEAIKKYYSKYFQNIENININKLYI